MKEVSAHDVQKAMRSVPAAELSVLASFAGDLEFEGADPSTRLARAATLALISEAFMWLQVRDIEKRQEHKTVYAEALHLWARFCSDQARIKQGEGGSDAQKTETREPPPLDREANPWSDSARAAWQELAIWFIELSEYALEQDLPGLLDPTERALWEVSE